MHTHTPPANAPIPPEVLAFFEAESLGGVQQIQPLKGGLISLTRRITTYSGASFVLKHSADAPLRLHQLEADGLRALGSVEGLRTPAVYAAGETFLLLEDLGSAPPAPDYWERAGRGIARQHRHNRPRFGYTEDNYRGLLVQHNPWTDDGHAFFIQHRILRYLDLPRVRRVFSTPERRTIARFAARLRELIPAQPAALLHGDLWHENMLTDPQGQPALVDPAVYYGWPEADLSMMLDHAHADRFFGAYNEISPLAPGWQQRLPLLGIRDWLSSVAHFGERSRGGPKIRALIAPFADRG